MTDKTKTEYENIDSSRWFTAEITEGYLLVQRVRQWDKKVFTTIFNAPFKVTFLDKKLVCVGEPLCYFVGRIHPYNHPYDQGVEAIQRYNKDVITYRKEKSINPYCYEPSRYTSKMYLEKSPIGCIAGAYHVLTEQPLVDLAKMEPGYKVETIDLPHYMFDIYIWNAEFEKGWNSIPEEEKDPLNSDLKKYIPKPETPPVVRKKTFLDLFK